MPVSWWQRPHTMAVRALEKKKEGDLNALRTASPTTGGTGPGEGWRRVSPILRYSVPAGETLIPAWLVEVVPRGGNPSRRPLLAGFAP